MIGACKGTSLRFEDLKNDRKSGTEVQVKSIKIGRICDFMSWTSGWNEFMDI